VARVGIIGRGRLGSALGAVLERRGHAITFADSGGGHAQAVQGAEVVILAVPYWNITEAVSSCGDLSGKVVWSCVNALKQDLSGLAVGFDTSAGEQVAALAREARVVSAQPPFAQAIAAGTLTTPAVGPPRSCAATTTVRRSWWRGSCRRSGQTRSTPARFRSRGWSSRR